jgi:quercetin dioxygenase-like cupin family protein
MIAIRKNGRTIARGLTRAALVAGALSVAAAAAHAGQCPADKTGADVTKPSTAAAQGVTDVVLGSIDLAKEPASIPDRQFRLRRLEIKPGGIVPWHSHGDRPAIIYIVKGEVLEYASNCAVPIVHKAGEVAVETHATAHWWKNTGKTTVILLSADLLHSGAEQHMM